MLFWSMNACAACAVRNTRAFDAWRVLVIRLAYALCRYVERLLAVVMLMMYVVFIVLSFGVFWLVFITCSLSESSPKMAKR